MRRSLLLAVAAWFAVLALSPLPAVAQTAAGPPAGRPDPELIRTCCDEGARHAADWNLRAAKSAYLRAAWIVEKHFRDHALAGRAYLGLAEVALARRELWTSNYFILAHEHGALEPGRAVPTAEGLAFLLFSPAQASGLDPLMRLGGKLFAKLPDDFRDDLAGFGPGKSPATADGARLAARAVETAESLSIGKAPRYFPLAVLDRALELHRQRLGQSDDAAAERTAAGLATEVAKRAKHVAEQVRAEAKRLGVKDNAAGVPGHPALAFALGETRRMRWRADRSIKAQARVAEACYRVTLAAEPDHAGAARGLTEILLATDRRDAAGATMKSLVRTLLTPSRAWSGEPAIAAAPRYIRAIDTLELLLDDTADGEARPWAKSLMAWGDEAEVEAYLGCGQRFHPEDEVAAWNDLGGHLDCNIGYSLMRRWDLSRAEQLLMRCVAENRPGRERLVGVLPRAYSNLGHICILRGDLARAIACYRKSTRLDPENAIAANNLGALLGILGSITRQIDLIQEGLHCYERATELAPDYVYARSSLQFMRNVHLNWHRFEAGNRSPAVVWSYANSFLFAARSLAGAAEPGDLRAMQIVDAGLSALPPREEMIEIYGPTGTPLPLKGASRQRTLREQLTEVFDTCRPRAIGRYEELLEAHGADNPHLNFCLGEVHRLALRRGADSHRDRAAACYQKTLDAAPDHVFAALRLADLWRPVGREKEAVQRLDVVVTQLLQPWRPWPGEPETPARPRARAVIDLVGKLEPGTDAKKGPLVEFRKRAADAALAAQRAHAEKYLGGMDPEAWQELGSLEVSAAEHLGDRDRLSGALKALDRAMRLDPGRAAEPAVDKIRVLRRLGRTLDAEALRHSMRERFPKDARFAPTPWTTDGK